MYKHIIIRLGWFFDILNGRGLYAKKPAEIIYLVRKLQQLDRKKMRAGTIQAREHVRCELPPR